MPRRFTSEQDTLLAKAHAAGTTVRALAAEHGCAEVTVTRAVRRAGGSVRSRGYAAGTRQGRHSTNWRGGRLVRTSGYVEVYVDPDDTLAAMRDPRGRVLEHRLVMARQLGRPLFADENVHHINGVRGDNRPENLELWSTSQPCGQRVEDKIAWAEELLRRYGRG